MFLGVVLPDIRCANGIIHLISEALPWPEDTLPGVRKVVFVCLSKNVVDFFLFSQLNGKKCSRSNQVNAYEGG